MRLFYNEHMGWIEVVTGCMFSGKSEELIKRLVRVKYANQKFVVFNHAIDQRYGKSKVASHSSISIEAIPVKDVAEMFMKVETEFCDVQVIGIDEVQFFGDDVVTFCEEMANKGKRVIVAGLDQDFTGKPFKPMDELLARAEFVDKFSAICKICGSPASRTQRLINGEPAYEDDPIIFVGATESYEARCRKHHEVKKRGK
ncbi:MAG: thymidine kinase [Fusobacteriaceae bacterium]